MCGIAGYWGEPGLPRARVLLEEMNRALAHRGPDGDAVWVGPQVGLAHRRLAIIDLECGKQPMVSADGRYHIVFNGEIYNHRHLRTLLESAGYNFKTRSDTEVIPSAIQHWGRQDALLRLRGMFAFALYDSQLRTLLLARDRVGIKPLYVARTSELVLFGSEPKALLCNGLIDGKTDGAALLDFFTLGESLSPSTAWANIRELEPGTWLHFSGATETKGRYWGWDAHSKKHYSEEEAVGKLSAVLSDSVEAHLESDVPVASFLSGGIDSSVLVALLCGPLSVKIDTFNVGFDEARYDESAHARAVAEHCGSLHHELRVGKGQGDPDLFQKVVEQYDQPFGDSSSIPTYLVCKQIAAQHKVVISGDGGDEMFGGYSRYQSARDLATLGKIPGACAGLKALARMMALHDPDRSRMLKKAADFAGLPRAHMMCALHTYFRNGELKSLLIPDFYRELVREGTSAERWADMVPAGVNDPAEQLMSAEIASLLHADYLRKVDVASSAHGLEVRTPYLDTEVFRFSAELETGLKVRRNSSKHVLRLLARRLLPARVIDRPKQGFGVPLDRWAGGRMRQFFRDLLMGDSARGSRVLDQTAVCDLLDVFEGARGTTELSRYQAYQRIFMLASFELWTRKWKPILVGL